MHRACSKFVLRAGFSIEKVNIASLGASLAVAAICVGLTACADDPKYPSLSKISDLGTILTPEERQKAVEDLQKQDQAAHADVMKTASK
jgi:uncharacterized membrane protein YgcG